MTEKELIEKLSDIEHQRWADWQRYVFQKGQRINGGVWTLPEEFVSRWTRQINTPYSELSEQEKQSDRDQVMRYLPLIKEYFSQVPPEEEVYDDSAEQQAKAEAEQAQYEAEQQAMAEANAQGEAEAAQADQH